MFGLEGDLPNDALRDLCRRSPMEHSTVALVTRQVVRRPAGCVLREQASRFSPSEDCKSRRLSVLAKGTRVDEAFSLLATTHSTQPYPNDALTSVPASPLLRMATSTSPTHCQCHIMRSCQGQRMKGASNRATPTWTARTCDS